MGKLNPELHAVSPPIPQPSHNRSKQETNTQKAWTIAWCHAGDSGGSKRAAFEMVRELSKRGHIIDEYVIRLGEPNLQHFPLQPYIRHSFQLTFKPIGRWLRPYLLDAWVVFFLTILQMRGIRRNLEQLSGEINRRGYDLVHIDQCSPCLAVSLLPYLLTPAVVYTHEASNRRQQSFGRSGSAKPESLLRGRYAWLCELAERMSNDIKNQEDMENMRRAKSILTNSYYSKEAIFQRNFCLATVCCYGVDTDIFRPSPVKPERMILSAGRIVVAKQHHTVIEAAGMIPESRRPRVLIATPEDVTRQQDVQYCESLKRLAATNKVDLAIRFNPTQDELVTLYNRAVSMVFVPIMEPFGLVALEAMACGTAVIGVREAGIRESVIDGVTGVLVERDTKEIAQAIDYLVQNEDVRTKLGQHAVESVRAEWTWRRTIDHYENHVGKFLP